MQVKSSAKRGYRRGSVERFCEVCGTQFFTTPGKVAKGRARWCSRDCRGQAARLQPVSFTCRQCGQNRMLVGFQRQMFTKGRKQFCTTECWYAYVREHPEANGQFRGGRTPYYGPDWNQQSRLARMRDNYTCQDCGGKPKHRLDVHHIVPRRTFHEDFIAANVLENLVSLCKRCHRLREVEFDGMFCPDLRPGAPGYVRRGEASPQARLTEADVRAIRAEYTGAWGQQSTLARRHGVTPGEIAHIVKGRSWKSLL